MYQNKKKKAVTLVELIISLLLLSTIVLAGFAVELAMRRMSVKPRVESKLFDELIPVLEMIRKDFEYSSTGVIYNTSIKNFTLGEKGVQIRVGDIYSWTWHGYSWQGTAGQNPYQFWFYNDTVGSPNNYAVIGYGITGFDYSIGNTNTSLSVEISAIKDSTKAYSPIFNPEVTLNSTFFSRTVSAL